MLQNLLIQKYVKNVRIHKHFSKFEESFYLPFHTYKQAVDVLRDAYFSDVTNVTAVGNANIALMSDLAFSDSMIKAAVLQAEANTNRTLQKSQQKNTFLLR